MAANTGFNRRTYRAKAVEYALGTTSGGTPQVVVGLAVQDPEAEEKSFTWYGFLTDKTIDRTIEALRTLGWQGTELDDLTGIERNEVSIVVEDEEYEGKVRARVVFINSSGGLALKNRLDAGGAKALAAQMRDRVKAYDANKKAGGAPRAAPAAPPPPADLGGDIPF